MPSVFIELMHVKMNEQIDSYPQVGSYRVHQISLSYHTVFPARNLKTKKHKKTFS